MGFFDNLRDRFSGGNDNDDYYEDDYYEDDFEDDDQGNGLLGNTPRPEAESVSVYTRSGRPVSNNAGGPTGYEGQNLDGAGYASTYRREDGARPASATQRSSAPSQLPPYVLVAKAYDDVQSVVRRVRTNQAVVLVLDSVPGAVATRILDFCYGLSFGIDGEVQQLASRTFAVLPQGVTVDPDEVDRQVASLLGEE